MRKLRIFLSICCLTGLVSACGKGGNSSSSKSSKSKVACSDFEDCLDFPPLSIHPSMSLQAYPSLDARLPELKADLDKLATSGSLYPIDLSSNLSTSAKYFQPVFGGKSATDVKRYLEERVKYLLPDDANLVAYTQRADATTTAVLASNLGVLLWFEQLYQGTALFTFVGNTKIEVTSSRVGLVSLGSSYWSYGDVGGKKVSAARIATLIHEGRHSDCTNGLSINVLNQAVADSNSGSSDPLVAIRDNSSCGHLHVVCPNDFPVTELRGKAACDQKPWGAYTIETVFSQAIAFNCPSCNRLEIEVAKISAVDSRSRLIPLSNSSTVDHYEKLLSGSFGAAEMGSMGLVSP